MDLVRLLDLACDSTKQISPFFFGIASIGETHGAVDGSIYPAFSDTLVLFEIGLSMPWDICILLLRWVQVGRVYAMPVIEVGVLGGA